MRQRVRIDDGSGYTTVVTTEVRPTKLPAPAVPTGDKDDRGRSFHHLMSHLRHGKISAEVFSRERLATIPVDPDAQPASEEEIKVALEGGRKGSDNGKEAKVQKARDDQGKGEKPRVRRSAAARDEQVARSKDRKRRKKGVAKGRPQEPKVKKHKKGL